MPKRQFIAIVSGGQTGADRAALDWAIARGIPHGGWCPKGRRAEDGTIDMRYQLREWAARGYRQRTRQNVIDSDGTLILNLGLLDSGSLETQALCGRFGKPCLVVQMEPGNEEAKAENVRKWLREHAIRTLNIAGPRESKRPGIYAAVTSFLEIVATAEIKERARK